MIIIICNKKVNNYTYKKCHNECILSQQEELVHLKTIPNSLAVFCLATYGEGDPTDNAMEFVDWLKSGDGDLTGLNYAVCILGVISDLRCITFALN